HHEIADVVAEEALRAVHEVLEPHALAARHAKAQRGRGSLRLSMRAPGGGEITAGAGVARRLARGELRAARQFQLPRGAEARVDHLLTFEHRELPRVQRATLRLAVGYSLILPVRARVPVDDEPAPVRHESRGVDVEDAFLVLVLHEKHHLTVSHT